MSEAQRKARENPYHKDHVTYDAERAGRAFRHGQAPHFSLRTAESIEGALIVAACQPKTAAHNARVWQANRGPRGRKPLARAPVQHPHLFANVNCAVSNMEAYLGRLLTKGAPMSTSFTAPLSTPFGY